MEMLGVVAVQGLNTPDASRVVGFRAKRALSCVQSSTADISGTRNLLWSRHILMPTFDANSYSFNALRLYSPLFHQDQTIDGLCKMLKADRKPSITQLVQTTIVLGSELRSIVL
jgi:hypothetical protein